ncbi:DNA gyrase inhibitor YacG [Enterovirga aerilata]|uniref:DNA gyrase inhibitor YacG n=1 Tax=Enterovirga aerilata TaxID=2730920 RepID=UPI001FEFE2C6|nr:DNA gyrase inhibitor YacG [Enterovirga sp. DB1703]
MTKPRTEPACPICGAPRSPRFRPFCSARCADADLQRWLSDAYVIPVAEDEEQAAANEADDLAGQSERGRL